MVMIGILVLLRRVLMAMTTFPLLMFDVMMRPLKIWGQQKCMMRVLMAMTTFPLLTFDMTMIPLTIWGQQKCMMSDMDVRTVAMAAIRSVEKKWGVEVKNMKHPSSLNILIIGLA
jgi:hypothetical protein